MAAEADCIAEAVRTCFHFLGRIKAVHREIQPVEVFPHFAGNAIANRARILACLGDTLHDGTGIVLAKREKFKDGWRVGLIINPPESFLFSRHDDQRLPSQAVAVPGLFQQRMKIYVEDSSRVFGPLDVSWQPEK